MSVYRPDGRPPDPERECLRKRKFVDLETTEEFAHHWGHFVYKCGTCGNLHLSKILGDLDEVLVAEVNLKGFLRRHNFRFDSEGDRGSFWTNGAGRVMVLRSYTNKQADLRNVMDEIRILARKKKAIEEAAARETAKQADDAAKKAAEHAKKTEEGLYPAKELIQELVSMGKTPQEMSDRLNAQGIKHPMGTKWTAKEIEEWVPASRDNIPRTPEQHAVAQREAAKVAESRTENAVSKKTGKTYKKFTGDERRYVFGRIKAMMEAKMDNEAIARALHSEGVRLPTGKPMTPQYVSANRNNWKAAPKSMAKYASILMPRLAAGKPAPPPVPPRPVVVAPTPPPPPPVAEARRSRFGLPLSVEAVLRDPEVGALHRLQVMMVFVSWPDSAQSILGDKNISVEAKIAVMEAIGTRRGEKNAEEKTGPAGPQSGPAAR